MNFSTLQKSAGTGVAKNSNLQFSKARLTEFGDLPQGEIPEALNYDLPFSSTQLKNGITVASEVSKASNVASITVLVKSGTRNETLENSGVNQFIATLNQRGTASKNRAAVEQAIAGFGGNFDVQVGRETTTYTLTFQSSQLNAATEFLGDILLNSVYNK